MAQRIEAAPTPDDVTRIAHQLVHAEVIIRAVGASLSGGRPIWHSCNKRSIQNWPNRKPLIRSRPWE